MRKLRVVGTLALTVMFAVTAFAWAPGTHAYIAQRLAPRADLFNLQFGAVVPDMNQVLSSDQNSIFFLATHYGFEGLWESTAIVPGANARSLALGFVTHNEAFGADRYAHIRSNLYPKYVNSDPRYVGQNGYVWVKAGQLCSTMRRQLQAGGQYGGLGAVLLSDPMNCHFIVEYAMDLLLKSTRDPQIGQKLLAAAATYDDKSLAELFIAGYPELGPAFATYQGAWSQLIQMYANALNQPTLQKSVPAVRDFLELLAEQLLGAQIRAALGLPIDAPIPDAVKQQLKTLIELGLVDSLILCSYDFNLEVDLTIMSVRQNLAKHGVIY